jgi:preprotein translocase subunit SecD
MAGIFLDWRLYPNMKQYRTLIFILIIVGLAIYMVLPNNAGFFGRPISTHLGLDLVGGVQVLLEADLPETTPVESSSMDTARAIVENRVNGLGVSEAVVQRAGDRRILVEIPNVQDPEQATAAIKETGLLEFVDMTDLTVEQAVSLTGQKIKTDYATSGATITPSDTVTSTNPLLGTVYHTVMTGDQLSEVGVTQGSVGSYEVPFKLKPAGAQIFKDFTTNHVGQVLALVLDKKVISAPRINNAITEGTASITGSFTADEANALAVQLRYGSLPIPLRVAESRTIGPSLGQDSLAKSMRAGIVGFIIVILFMILYYRLPGSIAALAILIYAAIAFALFRFIPVTLTLPGIAGLMLSTGSALDANILIFERLKEELRDGRPLTNAVGLAWQRAWPSIRDSNAATIITCAILFWFGSAFGATIVKGFSLTLALGVFVSLFTAIIVTRTFLSLVLTRFQPKNLPQWFGL